MLQKINTLLNRALSNACTYITAQRYLIIWDKAKKTIIFDIKNVIYCVNLFKMKLKSTLLHD